MQSFVHLSKFNKYFFITLEGYIHLLPAGNGSKLHKLMPTTVEDE